MKKLFFDEVLFLVGGIFSHEQAYIIPRRPVLSFSEFCEKQIQNYEEQEDSGIPFENYVKRNSSGKYKIILGSAGFSLREEGLFFEEKPACKKDIENTINIRINNIMETCMSKQKPACTISDYSIKAYNTLLLWFSIIQDGKIL